VSYGEVQYQVALALGARHQHLQCDTRDSLMRDKSQESKNINSVINPKSSYEGCLCTIQKNILFQKTKKIKLNLTGNCWKVAKVFL